CGTLLLLISFVGAEVRKRSSGPSLRQACTNAYDYGDPREPYRVLGNGNPLRLDLLACIACARMGGRAWIAGAALTSLCARAARSMGW
ncbi:unnamed protein product, partial [Ectocarpus sp. 6 AP-2014]